ncbi:MAG: DUF4433 domain-containing protein [Bacteroidales bacterium]|nr:DUF4433 domain-containing protein [Bacteroidales bacterium]
MTHIENIPHILQYGIVHYSSPNRNQNFISIGDKSLIDFRSTKSVYVGNKTIVLGDFIPFYFGVRMPMLYVIQHGGNFVEKARKAEEIVYVAVSLNEVVENNFLFYFSDGHATDSLTTFYDKRSISNLPSIIDWKAVTAQYWAGDGIETDLKRRKQAEFLVKEDIPASFIIGFACYNVTSKSKLVSFGIDDSKIKVFPNAYY